MTSTTEYRNTWIKERRPGIFHLTWVFILFVAKRKISDVSLKFIRTHQSRESLRNSAISKQLNIVESKKGTTDYRRDLHWWRSIASISRVNQCLTCQSEAGQLLLVVLHGCFTVGNFESRFSLRQICMLDIPSTNAFQPHKDQIR